MLKWLGKQQTEVNIGHTAARIGSVDWRQLAHKNDDCWHQIDAMQVMIDVGANKGYSLARFIDTWNPSSNFTSRRVFDNRALACITMRNCLLYQVSECT